MDTKVKNKIAMELLESGLIEVEFHTKRLQLQLCNGTIYTYMWSEWLHEVPKLDGKSELVAEWSWQEVNKSSNIKDTFEFIDAYEALK